MADAAGSEPGAGVIQDLAQVRQKPNAAALGDSLPHDLGGGGGLAEACGSNQDRCP